MVEASHAWIQLNGLAAMPFGAIHVAALARDFAEHMMRLRAPAIGGKHGLGFLLGRGEVVALQASVRSDDGCRELALERRVLRYRGGGALVAQAEKR